MAVVKTAEANQNPPEHWLPPGCILPSTFAEGDNSKVEDVVGRKASGIKVRVLPFKRAAPARIISTPDFDS
jgi:hypothetical protein